MGYAAVAVTAVSQWYMGLAALSDLVGGFLLGAAFANLALRVGGIDAILTSWVNRRLSRASSEKRAAVIYNPTKTLFLRKALAQGKVAKGGAAMLVLQAVRAHEIWNGDSYTDKQIESIICDMEERIDEQNQTK